MQVAARCLCSYTSTLMLVALLLLYTVCVNQAATSISASNSHAATTTGTGTDDYCSPGLSTKGVTRPKGDIILEYGSSLEIFCILNPAKTSRNASSLMFYVNSTPVSPDHLEIINDTTLRLYIEKPEPSKSMYYCKLMPDLENRIDIDESVCLNSVAVGFKPQEVRNFSCISMNWENLTCTWTPPVNYVKTVHKLVYSLPGRAGRRISYNCPDSLDVHENRCFWDRTTVVVYRQPYEYYYFTMTIENPFGSIKQQMKFHHYAYVVPSKPVNLTYVSKTSNSIKITWSVGFPMQNFPPGVDQKVEYKSQWDVQNEAWTVVNTSQLNAKFSSHSFNITGLKYPHSLYDIRVFMKSPKASGNDKWSKPATIAIRTLPTVPAKPPDTHLGSYEISRGLAPEMKRSRDVYLYWQQIPEYLYNGDNFEYRVKSIDKFGNEHDVEPYEVTKAYAKFKALSLKEYNFKVYSYNSEGYSKTGSFVHIPSIENVVPEPLTFTKIAFENGVFELSWKQPEDSSRIESYTIFSCENKADRPYQCVGYLQWESVPKDTLIKNVTVPNEDKIYQFAIASNSKTESSGMIWASCTVIHNKVVGKMESVWISNIGSTFIELGWKLECSDRVGVVSGYRIYYCPLASPGTKDCKGERKSTTIMGDPPMTAHGNVTGLKPYTTYMLAISVLTKSGGEGLHSDVLFNTTLEDSPDMPPRNVKVTDVTNTSMFISWEPPLNMNGVLRSYLIYFNSSEPRQVTQETQWLQLEDLYSYYVYNVSVAACTVTCSQLSTPILVKTLAGSPGIMEHPSTSFVNKTEAAVYWSPPSYPGGPLNYYQLMVIKSNDNTNSSEVYDVKGNRTIVEMQCNSEEESLIYWFAVRAVNIRYEDNTTYFGPWSLPGEKTCYNTGLPKSIVVIIWIFAMVAVVALFFGFIYVARWMWVCCKEMLDVKVKLPPGLDPPKHENEKDAECHQRMHGFPEGMIIDSQLTGPPPDQELLLLRKADGDCDGDGDSSGCSSAHESVSSSLTSGTHISDSGTEADQRADSPDVVFADTSSPASSSIRQRNVSNREGSRFIDPYVIMGSDSSPDLTESESVYTGFLVRGANGPAGTSYCRVGSANNKTPTKSYVSLTMPSINNSSMQGLNSSGYVSHPPMWSATDANTTEMNKQQQQQAPLPPTSPRNVTVTATPKGYVMAGTQPQAAPATSLSYCRLGWEKPVPAPVPGSDYVTLPTTSKKNASEL